MSVARFAPSFTRPYIMNASAANTAMIAIVTSNSTKVNPAPQPPTHRESAAPTRCTGRLPFNSQPI